MFRTIRVGSRQSKNVIGKVPSGGPNLLPIQNPLVAIKSGLQTQTSQVTTSVRFAVSLAPHIFVGKDSREVILLLLFGSPCQQRVPEHRDPETIIRSTCRHARFGKFFSQYHLLESRHSTTAVLSWPTWR